MGHERWFRGQHDGQGRPFDWRAAARQHAVPETLARALYERAVHQARGATQLEEIYLALLTDARPDAQRPSPGKVTRTMRLETERAHRHQRSAQPSRPGRRSAAPGKVTLTSYLAPRAAAFRDQPSETDGERTYSEMTHAALQRPSENTRHMADEFEQTLDALLGTGTAMSQELWTDIEVAEDAGLGEAPWTAEAAEHTPEPLPEALRARMERAFGQRFDHVRLHRDSLMPAGRQAFTRGNDIYLGPDTIAPDSPEGERILAHELAHVAQQARPTISWEPRPTIAALEADAHEASLQALAGQAAAVRLAAPAGLALNYTDNPGPVDDPARRRGPQGAPSGGAPAGARSARAPAPAGQPGGTPVAARGPAAGQAPSREPGSGRGADTAPAGAQPGAMPGGAASRNAGPGAGASGRSASSPAGASGGSELLLREAPDTLSAPAQARLGQIDGNIQGAAERVNELPTADASTTAARGAVEEPQAEQDAHAEAGVAREIDDRPPPSPEIEAACERIREVIRAKRPPDEESLVNARPREMADQAGGEMNSGIESRADSVREGYTDMENTPPGQPSREPVPVELPPEQVDIPEIDAAAGVPDQLSSEDVSLEADLSAQRQRIEEAGMTTEAAELVQDGPIAEARTGVTDLEAMAQADPDQVLADQSAAIAQAAGDMQALQEAAEQALAQARSGTVGTLGTRSDEITGSEEQQRAQAGQRMQAIFDRARTDVDGLLQPLSSAALARWDAGVDRLASDFESSLASVKQRIEERYRTEDDWDPFDEIASGVTQAWDYVAGLPDWVVEEYDRAEQLFADGCTTLITDISRDLNAVIEDCQAIIQQARDDIDEIVTSLPEELQAWAQGEAARLGTELDALESQVTETQQTLNQDLIDRSNAAVQEVRERVHELREAAKGVVGRIADAIAAFLDDPARFIIDGLLRVLGIPPTNFWALVDQLGNVIDGIAADPMGFANNLMAGVGQGFQQFFGNFPVHIGQGLFAWLFSKMGEAGVTMPRDFSIPSIVSLVLDIMGINWQRIRMLLARHIGEQNVAHIEQAYDIITTFVARGPLGLVELMREQLDPASIVNMIRETAIRYLMESIVTRVAARILMMLNPAGAILQAIEAIYRVLSWIYENAARIFTLIEAVVNGAAQVLAGNVGGLAGLVEHALVGLMVPVIDFLADYLGLGGIPEAIRDLVMGLQARIERILDRVIGFIAEKARTLLARMGIGGQGAPPAAEGGQGANGAMPDLTVHFQADEEQHRLWVTKDGSQPRIMVASTPMTVDQRLGDWEERRNELSKDPEDKQALASRLIAQARQELQQLITAAQALPANQQTDPGARNAGTLAHSQGSGPPNRVVNEVKAEEQGLATILKQLFDLYGDVALPGDLDRRYQEALTDPNFQGNFTAENWKTRFGLQRSQAFEDLQSLRSQNRVEQPQRGQYAFGPLSEQEVITRARQAVAAQGRTSAEIGAPAGRNRTFSTADVRAFCVTAKVVPDTSLTPSAMAGLMRVLSSRNEIKETSPGTGTYMWAPMPPQRFLPDAWDGEEVRRLYYINGSGFGSTSQTVRTRDMGQIRRTITLYDAGQIEDHEDLWDSLKALRIVSDHTYDPAKKAAYLDQGNYDVDHLLPLAKHWCIGGLGTSPGNDTDEGTRQRIAGNDSNLRMVPSSDNRSKSAEGYGYKQRWWVGPNFRGPGSSKGYEWADANTKFKNFV